MNKRAAILVAAERMFLDCGYEGVSMDQIASEAGVSKLTVYSHFGDKDALFVEAVRGYCEKQLPTSVFDSDPTVPLRERLLSIGRAFFAMAGSPQAISGHRLLCSPQMVEKRLGRLFWDCGPKRFQSEFATFLEQRIAIGQLQIDDVATASGQFFALLKGELYQRLIMGVCDEDASAAVHEKHVAAAVDTFLLAYGRRS